MYSTCLFCKKPLGSNDTVEHFPVGRRLAYDETKGRLWVVCRKCERWNLTPLEERWEAIEECEKLFRSTRVRMSTDEIGLARLPSGMELVRIGEPMRPEFAAWRYGDQFGRRRRKNIIVTGALVGAIGAIAAGGMAAGVGIGSAPQLIHVITNLRPLAKIQLSDGRKLTLRRSHLPSARLLKQEGTGDPYLEFKHRDGTCRVGGDEALWVAGQVMVGVNVSGGNKRVVSDAVSQIEDAGNPEAFVENKLLELSDVDNTINTGRRKPKGNLLKLDAPVRLALEMSLHEEQERRALAGELVMLELAWKQAEEVAAIADNLFVPESTTSFIEEHRPDDRS